MTCRATLLVAVVTAALATAAVAQNIYTWKDKNGVVHFADQKPQGVQNVEQRSLGENAPVLSTGGDETPGANPGSEAAGTPSPAGGAAAQDLEQEPRPARVIVTEHNAKPDGQQTRKVTGVVKNVGGEIAHRVSVMVSITDPGQGTTCLSGEISVEPSDLDPGQTGTFSDYVTTPCFLGNAGVDIHPAWD